MLLTCCCNNLLAYLSYGRCLSRIIQPTEMLSEVFDFEDVSPVIKEDINEED